MGPFKWKSYDEIYTIVTSIAKVCEQRELCPLIEEEGKRFRFIGIYLKTREEWMCTWIASWYFSGAVVPLYDTLGDDSIEWVVKQCSLKTIVTIAAKVSKLAKLKAADKLPTLTVVILLDKPSETDLNLSKESGIQLLLYEDVIAEGKTSSVVLRPQVTPDSVAMICYTSGTTAMPKGVMLTHQNYISMAKALETLPYVHPQLGQIHLAWLPLAHVLEQFEVVAAMTYGVKSGFYAGDIMTLKDDIEELRPHYFGSVPRMLVRICERIDSELSKLTGFKRYLMQKATAAKLAILRKTGRNTHALWDRLVFNNIRKRMGGNTLIIFAGGAPTPPELLEKMKVWFSCGIVQGFGQTETTGPVFAQDEDDNIPMSIGLPLANVEAKLVDIPEMNYTCHDLVNGVPMPRGEILIRGPGVSPGYFRDPVLTRETFQSDGWVHSGDVAQMLPAGQLIIIDRKKQMFKLLQVPLDDPLFDSRFVPRPSQADLRSIALH